MRYVELTHHKKRLYLNDPPMSLEVSGDDELRTVFVKVPGWTEEAIPGYLELEVNISHYLDIDHLMGRDHHLAGLRGWLVKSSSDLLVAYVYELVSPSGCKRPRVHLAHFDDLPGFYMGIEALHRAVLRFSIHPQLLHHPHPFDLGPFYK